MNDQANSEAAAVAAVVQKNVEPRVIDVKTPDGRTAQLLLTTNSEGATSINSVKDYIAEYATHPERRTGTAEMTALASFIAHVNRFKDADSAIFANRDPKAPSLLAVIDYNPKGEEAEVEARFGEHRTNYAFPLSDEWIAWTSSNAKQFSQATFAEYIENRIADVTDPASAGDAAKDFVALLGAQFASPSGLLQLSRGLTVRVGLAVQNQANLGTGEASIRYEAKHTGEDGGPLLVPGAFLLAIPVFRGGARYQIATRLRYRVKDNQITWFYETYRADAVFDHAFNEACELAAKETALPLFMGAPEA